MVIYKNDSFKRRRSTRSRSNTLIQCLSKDSSQATSNVNTPGIRRFQRSYTSYTHLPPIGSSKYRDVWKRVRLKLRVVCILIKIHKEIRLYGANRLTLNLHSEEGTKFDEILFRKASTLFAATEELRLKEPVPALMLHPHSPFKSFWNWVVVLILLYSVIWTPFLISFFDITDYSPLDWFDICVNILFFIDFCINLISAYYDKDRNLITDRVSILKSYAKGWMFIDTLSWFPFDLFMDANSQIKGRFARILRLPKLYRLVRFSKLLKLMKTHIQKDILDKIQEFFSMRNSAMTIAKSYLTVILFVHIISCLWYLSAKLYEFSPDTWVCRYNYQDADIGTLYLTCLYWAFTTFSTVGYGDICPSTMLEYCLCLVWMAFGLYFFSFNISSLTALESSIDLKDNALANKLAIIEEFSAETNLPKDIRAKLKSSFKYSAEQRGFSWLEKINLLNEFPKLLRYEVAMAMHHGAARDLKFFKDKKQTLVCLIVPLLEPMFIEEDSVVYRADEAADEIFFLTKGIVMLEFGRNLIVKTIRKGQHFGDIEVCHKAKRRFLAYSNTYCEVLVMNKDVISQVQAEYPYLWRHVHVKAMQREQKYERTIVHFMEMEKFNRGDIEFEDFDSQFAGHVQRVLDGRIKELKKENREVGLEELVKKMNEVIELAQKRKASQAAWKG